MVRLIKTTGSFYTPREIVSYMADESLKQHFETHTDLTKSQIDALFVFIVLLFFFVTGLTI
jgi:hypothetical protein